MFEAAEVGRSLTKKEFDDLEPELHHTLLLLQQQLRQTRHSLIILVSGNERAGKGDLVVRLNRWFDNRDVQTCSYWEESDEEKQRPPMWRFWRDMPARGKICIMFGSWYTQPIGDAVSGSINMAELDQQLARIRDFERALTADDVIIAKLWFHISRTEQQRRLEQDDSHGLIKRTPQSQDFAQYQDQLTSISEHVVRLTDSGVAPWHIIEATDYRYRDFTVGNTIVSRMEPVLNTNNEKQGIDVPVFPGPNLRELQAKKSVNATVLDRVDLEQKLEGKDYSEHLGKLQKKLNQLAWLMHNKKRNAVLVFEGWDAAGKGSALRRITSAIDSRLYQVIPTAAPTDEEKAHHYLWRFWRHLPRAGRLIMYDRSWYGRVLVERVEALAREEEWRRAYAEINSFEDQLLEHGMMLCKFWIHISKDEQIKRFRDREKDIRKQHKITEEDWRNRQKWDDYKLAVNDMVAHTSTTRAPWTLVAGNDKKFARVQILTTVCNGLETVLGK
ncbi:MAG: polyphosphate:AMP phosphotransferase [Gammaproteobacteria bacterium]|nr:polyphosphate:AMP phosphotransferase [Gammaproteobacteria bacterium]